MALTKNANQPVKTFEAAEKTPNIVRQPERIFCARACVICCKHCKTFREKRINMRTHSKEGSYKVANFRVLIMNHGIFKGFQEVFLKLKMRQFLLLQESHSKLAKRVKSKACNMRIIMTADLPRRNIAALDRGS